MSAVEVGEFGDAVDGFFAARAGFRSGGFGVFADEAGGDVTEEEAHDGEAAADYDEVGFDAAVKVLISLFWIRVLSERSLHPDSRSADSPSGVRCTDHRRKQR